MIILFPYPGSGDNTGAFWNHSSALVGAAKDFQITFVATMNLNWWDDYHLAIDNIQFAPDCAAVAAITIHPADLATPEGAKAEFACGVKGDPAPTVAWYHLGSPLGGDKFSADSGRIWVDKYNSLIFNSTIATDIGTYTCNASNSLGYKVSSAQLVILDVSLTYNVYSNTMLYIMNAACETTLHNRI